MQKINRWWPVFLWAGLIFVGSSLPVVKTSTSYWEDFILKKLVHLLEYAALYLFLYRATYRNWQQALAISIVYAITDEIHQSFTPGREPAIRDVIIDSTGASVAGIILWKYQPILPKKLKNWLLK
ncbi:VanZ family protein [Candidatus Daviesbacteria bacterium]|nr:VanZ family protein [Candidatus Daviesbacteria bacterium]